MEGISSNSRIFGVGMVVVGGALVSAGLYRFFRGMGQSKREGRLFGAVLLLGVAPLALGFYLTRDLPRSDGSADEFMDAKGHQARPTSDQTLWLIPTPSASAETEKLGLLQRSLSDYYGVKVGIGQTWPVGEPDRIHVSQFINSCGLHVSPVSLGCLFVTARDLYDDNANFCFGFAQDAGRHEQLFIVGMVSLYRFQGERGGSLLLKTALHEVGHGMGLPHCEGRRCLMNAANTLEEAEETPFQLCERDLRRVAFVTGRT